MTAPRNKYPRRAVLAGDLTSAQRLQLLTGATRFRNGFDDPDVFREAWDLYRDVLTAEWIHSERKHWSYAVRPFAWWFCDHQQERPITNPHFTEKQIQLIRTDNRHFEHFGFLHTAILGGPDFEPLQEEEADYLDRLKLLTDEERVYLNSLDDELVFDDEMLSHFSQRQQFPRRRHNF